MLWACTSYTPQNTDTAVQVMLGGWQLDVFNHPKNMENIFFDFIKKERKRQTSAACYQSGKVIAHILR